jgi:hypothetical protein
VVLDSHAAARHRQILTVGVLDVCDELTSAGCGRVNLLVAMQKVERSSPFSRFGKGPHRRVFSVSAFVGRADTSRNRLPNADVQLSVARLPLSSALDRK